MADKVLFVDDEPAILAGIKRTLYREVEIDTAGGGAEALEMIRSKGPYAVVVSDMRMPGMSGAQLLARVREQTPQTVRMLLTGYSDINAAIEAINDGNIFRFLSKPCEKEQLLQAIQAGLEQHQLLISERELLENTLMSSVRVLTEVLSAASPQAFGRSMQVTRCVDQMMKTFELPGAWRFRAAAMLSQLGCVTLDPELLQHAYAVPKLSAEDQARFGKHPSAAMELLKKIPRLEPIAWMIGQQLEAEIPELAPGLKEPENREVAFGARMLRLAVAFNDLKAQLGSDEAVLLKLYGRSEEFGADLVASLSGMEPEITRRQLLKIPTVKLVVGMVLDQELRNHQGMLVVAKGQEVTPALLIRLINFSNAGIVDKEVLAFASS